MVTRHELPKGKGSSSAKEVATIAMVFLVAGVACVFVLVRGRLTSTQGARASTRLFWEQRSQELNRAASDAERR